MLKLTVDGETWLVLSPSVLQHELDRTLITMDVQRRWWLLPADYVARGQRPAHWYGSRDDALEGYALFGMVGAFSA